jgi:hypothetical protein
MTKQPVQKFKQGLVQVAVWQNESRNGDFYSLTFQRSYTDAEGAWHNATSFPLSALYDLMLATVRAYLWVRQNTEARRAA